MSDVGQALLDACATVGWHIGPAESGHHARRDFPASNEHKAEQASNQQQLRHADPASAVTACHPQPEYPAEKTIDKYTSLAAGTVGPAWLMDIRERILSELRSFCFLQSEEAKEFGFCVDDSEFIDTCLGEQRNLNDAGWQAFVERIRENGHFNYAVRLALQQCGILRWHEDDFQDDRLFVEWVPSDTDHHPQEGVGEFLDYLGARHPEETSPSRVRDSRSAIMYIESKPGLAGHARIGRVTFSKTRKTIYYNGHKFQSLKGGGYKANYYNVDTRMWYWISNCRTDGEDTLYPGIIEVDDDVREEYWLKIRNRPDMVRVTSFRSEGKYSKRRPR